MYAAWFVGAVAAVTVGTLVTFSLLKQWDMIPTGEPQVEPVILE